MLSAELSLHSHCTRPWPWPSWSTPTPLCCFFFHYTTTSCCVASLRFFKIYYTYTQGQNGFFFYCRVEYSVYGCVNIFIYDSGEFVFGRCIQSITNFDSFVSLLSLWGPTLSTTNIQLRYWITVVVVGRLLLDPNNTTMIRHCQLPC